MVFADGGLSNLIRLDHLIFTGDILAAIGIDFICIKVTAGAVSQLLITSFIPIWHMFYRFSVHLHLSVQCAGYVLLLDLHGASSIIPIPNHNINVADSNNFWSIQLCFSLAFK